MTAEVLQETEGVDLVPVGCNIFVAREFGDRPATDAELTALVDGLKFLAEDIEQKTKGQKLVIAVRGLEYVETDFQTEALTVAICGWAATEFGLTPRSFNVSFDRWQNRYTFEMLTNRVIHH